MTWECRLDSCCAQVGDAHTSCPFCGTPKHADSCRLVLAVTLRSGSKCTHGREVCSICDACDCWRARLDPFAERMRARRAAS